MDLFPLSARIYDALEDRPVIAPIVRLTRELAQKLDATWWQLPGVSGEVKRLENDYDWRWGPSVGAGRNDRWCEFAAVRTPDGDVQGAILYRLNTASFVDPGNGAVYVENLATAPWNRPWLVGNPKYRGVGEQLLLRAVSHSYMLGFDGRLNLLSFDDERTVKFYGNRGFEIVGDDDGLPMLEMSSETALSWLREEGYEI